jgi:hypothetical protein
MIGRYTLLTGVAALFMAIETAHAAEVNWPPWLHDVLDTIVPGAVLVISIMAIHFRIKHQRERVARIEKRRPDNAEGPENLMSIVPADLRSSKRK